MSGMEEAKSLNSEYFKQSGFFVNYQIQQLYERSSDFLSRAMQYGYQGIAGKPYENQFRRLGLEAFQILVNKSIHLPQVQARLDSTNEVEKGFTDVNDLRRKIATAVRDKVKDAEILKWWDAYVRVLVQVGLIKLYSNEDTPMNRFRR